MEMVSCAVMMMMIVVLLGSSVEMSSSAPSLTAECGEAIQKVTSCMMYATGKAAEPTKMCCDAVGDIREKEPVCLCFFVGQVHNGSKEIKSLGLQESKLLNLPSACHLTNTTPHNCPKLLGISPTSPAAAIFMNNNTTTSSATPVAVQGADNDKSSSFKQHNPLFIPLLLLSLIYITHFIF